MTKQILIAVLLALCVQPAFAQDEAATPAATPKESVAAPEPWLAATLSIATPLTLRVATLPAFGIGAPLGFGAGHVYAGDPARGAWVSIGGLGAFLAGGAYGLYGPDNSLYPRRWNQALYWSSVATIIYSLWAGYDAYHTAERAKKPDAE